MPLWLKGYIIAALVYGGREVWRVRRNHHQFVLREMKQNEDMDAQRAMARAYIVRPVVRGIGFPYYAALEIYERFE